MELKALYDSVANGEIEEVADGANAALAAGEVPDRILNEALIPAMTEVGRLFEAQEYYVPEMLMRWRPRACAIK
jgi:methanogenic corrinoid protein MtbC1